MLTFFKDVAAEADVPHFDPLCALTDVASAES